MSLPIRNGHRISRFVVFLKWMLLSCWNSSWGKVMKTIYLQILEISVTLYLLRCSNWVCEVNGRQTRWFREIIFKPKGLFICFISKFVIKLEVGLVVSYTTTTRSIFRKTGNWPTGCPWVWTDACSLPAVTLWPTSVKGHCFLTQPLPPPSTSFDTIASLLGHCFTTILDWI